MMKITFHFGINLIPIVLKMADMLRFRIIMASPGQILPMTILDRGMIIFIIHITLQIQLLQMEMLPLQDVQMVGYGQKFMDVTLLYY